MCPVEVKYWSRNFPKENSSTLSDIVLITPLIYINTVFDNHFFLPDPIMV